MEDRLQFINLKVQQACEKSGRKRDEISIIAVTKYATIERAEQVLQAGVCDLGESRWPDAGEKLSVIGNRATWHYIGHLQSRKVKDVVGRFEYIHSLDRLSLAREMDKRAAAAQVKIKAFVQVNVSGERSKHGLAPDELVDFVSNLYSYAHIEVIGLMTMAPHEHSPELTRPVFRELRHLRNRLNQKEVYGGHSIHHLSMGMSNDFEVAIEEGATWIRLGTILAGNEAKEGTK